MQNNFEEPRRPNYSAPKTEAEIEAIIAAVDDHTRFLSLREVEEVVGLKETSIFQLIKDGAFPPPLKLALRKNVWISTQVTEWKRKIIRDNLKY